MTSVNEYNIIPEEVDMSTEKRELERSSSPLKKSNSKEDIINESLE